MRFRFVELKNKVRFPNDNKVYIKVDDDKCVYLKDGKPAIRDKIHPGTIVECLGEMKLVRERKANSGGDIVYGPHDNPIVYLKLRIMGENGGKDIYLDCRQSEVEKTIRENNAVEYWIMSTDKRMRQVAAIEKQNAEFRKQDKLAMLAELGI